VCVAALLAFGGCSSDTSTPTGRGTRPSGNAGSGGKDTPDSSVPKGPELSIPDSGTDGDLPAACKNLQCKQQACASGTTAVTGTVFAPNGKLPLYNVRVYVPNAPLPKATPGLTCDR
jgi:hypothetical protein